MAETTPLVAATVYEESSGHVNGTDNSSFSGGTTACNIDYQALLYSRGILIAIALLGNLSFVIMVARVRSMRTIPNFHFINLAAADTLMIFTEIIYLSANGLTINGTISMADAKVVQFWDIFSKMWIFITPTFVCTALLTITLISVERYIAVCHPFKANRLNLQSKKRVIVLLISTWIIGLLMGVFALLTHNYSDSSTTLQAWFSVFTCFTVLPVCIVVICYAFVIAAVFKMNQHMTPKNSKISKATTEERSVLMLCVAITMLFFLCFAPVAANQLLSTYTLMSNTSSIEPRTISCLHALQTILLLVHLALSPILYSVGSQNRRRAFIRAFWSRCFVCGNQDQNSVENGTFFRLRPMRGSFNSNMRTTRVSEVTL
ncbi:kappa-type opioid receptor-like [Saccoglossus kowalevskii]|uniref:Kappa-type opioid receptor-like n=1 Tax=Saccoglossus kowalevskii TaxID=10224 RepID=A0ABM0M9K0_SACKO|nr:PREDICTED: kappa-type opioid receptor-like [Saccoglossus kowalevskii]